MSGQTLEFVLPGDLFARTGGYVYDRRILDGLTASGWCVRVHSMDPSFPTPSPHALREAEQILGQIPAGRTVVIDGLALGGMPDLVGKAAGRLRLIALIHHPLAFETGLDQDQARRLHDSEQRALTVTRRVIATSPATARDLTDSFDVPRERIRVVRPGTDPAPLASGSGSDRLHLLCVATLTPRKGHAVLFEALSRLRDAAWSLTCVGSATRDPATANRLASMIAALAFTDRITLAGELDEASLAERYHRADAFVLASHHEGYGMVFGEAIARGLPIVATRAGAIPETVPAAASLLVPPGDSAALATALRRLIQDAELREWLRAGARYARASLPSWQSASAQFATAIAEP